MRHAVLRAFVAAAGFLPAAVAYARDYPTITNYSDLIRVINTAADWLFGILLSLAVIFVIFAAYRFLNAAGDPKSLETAKMTILYAIVAVVVAVLAKTLIGLVDSFFSSV
ncbi:MAG: hypothetical protein Q7S84_04115 [bacterium]|nr:hypothetical protein [bacterium]